MLSGGVLHCPCGRRMAIHTAKPKAGHEFYYVCGLRRSNKGDCGSVRYHRVGETEAKVRSLVLGLLARPDEVRRRAEKYVKAEELARELPRLLDARRVVRDHDTIPNERTEENPLGMYRLTPDRIRHLTEEEVVRREREAEDERAARYRAAYEDLGLRVVAHPDGALEANWRFGEAVLRNRSDESKNRHATKHFRATEHPIVQSFQPGEA